MSSIKDLDSKAWWSYVNEDLKELLLQSLLLIEAANKWETNGGETFGRGTVPKENFHDYAFIVFPAAKAYEGFLKKLFLDMGFITDEDYSGRRFRIGKALNPNLEPQYRELESVYDRLVDYCGGRELADKLWETWKNGRNLIFHWFPNEKNAIDYGQARNLLKGILDTMDFAFRECRIKGEIEKPVTR